MSFPMKKRNFLTPAKRNSLTEQVTAKLRRAILGGRMKAGQRIVEEELASIMKTSRGPVRDALMVLEREGLIVREQHRGAMVVSLSTEDVEEVCSLRAALENFAFRCAIQRAAEKDLIAMEKTVDDLSHCLKKDFSMEKALDLDLQFHEQLVSLSGNRRLLSYWRELKSQIWFLMFSLNVSGFPKDADLSHRQIIEQIRRRNLKKGYALLKEHLENGYVDLVSTYMQRRRKPASGKRGAGLKADAE